MTTAKELAAALLSLPENEQNLQIATIKGLRHLGVSRSFGIRVLDHQGYEAATNGCYSAEQRLQFEEVIILKEGPEFV